MTEYNCVNVKLSNTQLSKLKSSIENVTEVTVNLSPNVVSESNDDTNLSTQVLTNP